MRQNHVAIAAAVHAFSWIAQFIGHGFAEGRAPALLDNVLQGKQIYLRIHRRQ
jgi:2-hydroxy fatty acid dioxygenase